MPYTEQQVQMMSSGNEIIRKMYQRVCKERIEEEKEETKTIQDLATYTPYHNMEMHPREHIPRDQQPFYTKFLNKRNKRK